MLPLCVVVLAGCGGDSGGTKPAASGTKPAASGGAGPKAVEIKLTDAGCDPATIKLDAGRTTFKVTNAGTGRVSEVEVLSGARILGEKENLVAGLSGSFTLDLQPGQYSLSCPGGTTAATGVVTVGGTAVGELHRPAAGRRRHRLPALRHDAGEGYSSSEGQVVRRRRQGG